jgi:chorismate dehydratase
MIIAVWNDLIGDFIAEAAATLGSRDAVQIDRRDPAECDRLLRGGYVDAALVSTIDLLLDTEPYDVLPAVAISTWNYPFARLHLSHGLDQPVREVAFNPRYRQEILLARILLKEHYAHEPVFRPTDTMDVEQLLATGADAALSVGTAEAIGARELITMDLGQEWYELSNYPMVWGLFATRAGESSPELIETLRSLGEAADAHRALWASRETTPELHEFFREDLRVRLDDLAVASLTELRQYLFYYHLTEEVVEIPFVVIETDDEEKDDDDAGDGPLL